MNNRVEKFLKQSIENGFMFLVVVLIGISLIFLISVFYKVFVILCVIFTMGMIITIIRRWWDARKVKEIKKSVSLKK